MALLDDVKNELAAINDAQLSCRKAQVTTMLRVSNKSVFKPGQIVVLAELDNQKGADWLTTAITEVYGHQAIQRATARKTTHGVVKSHIVMVTARAAELALQTGLLQRNGRMASVTRGLPPETMAAPVNARKAALRGAFLVAGNLSSPGERCLLEIVCPNEMVASAIKGLTNNLGINRDVSIQPVSNSRQCKVVLRDATAIERLLLAMGADETAKEWSGKRSDSETRGKANRLANFDDANMRRSAKAAVEACEKVTRAFEILDKDTLSDNLREAGELRLKYPDASLEQLGKLAEPSLSKDAIAGRLRRLILQAKKVEKRMAKEAAEKEKAAKAASGE